MQRHFLTLAFLILFATALRAQPLPERNAARIKQQLETLDVLGSVLYVGAHPDDENNQLLAWLVNEKKYRTAYLSLTRGDGGQNLIGDEQGEEMGAIRTEELLAARENDGALQFFTRANDFGFSKNAAEALKIWGHDRILADVVWVIRRFRPDIIICRFPEDSRAGHGHHWASAILAHEAFTAAADPSKFPEQLAYVQPWKARRVLWNTFNFGGNNTTAAGQFHIDAGGFNALLGKSYGEIAAESRSMHKSQGMGSSPSRGHRWEYFKTIAGDPPRKSLMDGVDIGWSRLKGGEQVDRLLKDVLAHFDVDDPARSVSGLLAVYKAVQALPEGYWKAEKQKALQAVILNCAGVWTEADAEGPYVTPGGTLQIQSRIMSQSDIPVTLQSVAFNGNVHKEGHKLTAHEEKTVTEQLTLPENTPVSQPYWLQEKHDPGYYHIGAQQLVGKPWNPAPAKVAWNITLQGVPFTVEQPVMYRYTDPVRGEVRQPLSVTPPVTADIRNGVYVFTDTASQAVYVRLRGFAGTSGKVQITVPEGFEALRNEIPFTLKAGEEQWVHFMIRPAAAVRENRHETLSIALSAGGKEYTRGIHEIRYDHIPAITLFPPATAAVVSMPLRISGRNIGYIMGAGDKVPDALRQVGYRVTLLTDAQLSSGDLQSFDAIVTGVRAYNTREALRNTQSRLLEYVKNGGTLVVQYNTNSRLVTDQLGPYPLSLSRDRVTDETAPVAFLKPDAAVLNTPNRIGPADFNDWIQERGLYFAGDADSHYQKPLSMHDPGEDPLDGSLLVTGYGKGKYVYTSLDFFRELPAGIPGAFRLFANLLSQEK